MAKTVTLPPKKVRTTVVALQGHPVAPDMPAVGDTLVWDGNEWTPTPAIGRSNRAGETQNLDTTVVGIQGTPVFPIGPVVQPGDALLWTGVDWKNYPVAKDLSAANLGPYLPISAYTPPDGGGGDFLPLTGGVLSGPGALTVGDVLTLEGAASAGGNSLVDMQGGSAVVQADGNGLLLQQLGDQYGLTSLLIANRDGLNGAMFTNEGLDLVDFAFQTSTGVTGTLRLDARAIPTGQFSFMLSGGTLMTIDSAGNVVCTGTLVRPGFTNGSNAAAGVVGEVLTASGSPTLGMAQGTNGAVTVATITLTPGDWDVYYFGNLNYTVATTGAAITSEGYVQLGVSGTGISNGTAFRFYPFGIAESPQPPIEFVLELIGGGANTFRVNITASTALALNASLFLSTALSNAWGSAVQQLNGTVWARRAR